MNTHLRTLARYGILASSHKFGKQKFKTTRKYNTSNSTKSSVRKLGQATVRV